jgi:hypothetical protein
MTVDRSSAMYERQPMAIGDAAAFGNVKQSIENAFSSGRVAEFLKSLERGGLRIRDFEKVLGSGKLGAGTAAEYMRLPNGDQGQIREFYLASLEQVQPNLRDKFFKLYAYY